MNKSLRSAPNETDALLDKIIEKKPLSRELLARRVSEGFDLNAPGVVIDGSPLFLSIPVMNIEAFRVLIDLGADPMRKDRDGASLLHQAANGSHPIIPAILAAGVPIEELDGDGNTALLWAALNGDSLSAEVLLAAGANPDATNHKGECARDILNHRSNHFRFALKKTA